MLTSIHANVGANAHFRVVPNADLWEEPEDGGGDPEKPLASGDSNP